MAKRCTLVKGTKLIIGTTEYEIYRAVPPKMTREGVETTTLSDDYARQDPGEVITTGDLEVDIPYDATLVGTLKTAMEAADPSTYAIKYADAKGWTFSGFLKEMGEPEIAANGKLIIKLVIAVDGEPTQITPAG